MSRFSAPIEGAPRGGAYVTVPPEVIEELGGGGRIPVTASFDGVAYRGSIVRMGGSSVLGVLKGIREGLGKEVGDIVEVIVDLDVEAREVELPPELVELALEANPAARRAFECSQLQPPARTCDVCGGGQEARDPGAAGQEDDRCCCSHDDGRSILR